MDDDTDDEMDDDAGGDEGGDATEGESGGDLTGGNNSFSGSEENKKSKLFDEYTEIRNVAFELKNVINKNKNIIKEEKEKELTEILLGELSETIENIDTVTTKRFAKGTYNELMYIFMIIKTEVLKISSIFSKLYKINEK